MSEAVLTREQILEAAEETLRRYGPAKATVVDVARALHVSHGSVYRHFESKTALRDAVAERWLARIAAPLAEGADSAGGAAAQGPAPERLRRWLHLLAATKRERASSDPQLFATYMALVNEARAVAAAHVAGLVAQIESIIADGVANGEFAPVDPPTAAQAVFDAAVRFHNPLHAAEWGQEDMAARLDAVCELVLRGLETRSVVAPIPPVAR